MAFSPLRRPHDASVWPGLQAAEKLVHVLGVGKLLHVEAPEGTHRRQAIEECCRPLAGHFPAQQGFHVADLEAPGPEEQKVALVAAERADQYVRLVDQLGDENLFQRTAIAAGEPGRQLRQAPVGQYRGNASFVGAEQGGVIRRLPEAAGEKADTGVQVGMHGGSGLLRLPSPALAIGIGKQVQRSSDRLLLVAEGHFAQIALALPEFERQFGHRMFGTAMSLAQKRVAQIGAAGLKAFLAVAHRSQRVIDNALALGFRGVDDALCAGFGLKQAYQMIFHLAPWPRPGHS